MPVQRPAGVLCPKWEPASTGSKLCRYYVKPGELQPEGLCRLPDELLCVEWVRRFGTDAQRAALALPPTQPQGGQGQAPPPPPAAPPAAPLALAAQGSPLPSPGPYYDSARDGPARTPFAGPLLALPGPFVPAKGVDPQGLAALEQAGAEVELEAVHLGGTITLVAARTGRTDRTELTFREAAVLRLLVDAFPGAHVVGYRHGVPAAAATRTELGNPASPGLPAAAAAEWPAQAYPPARSRCGACGEPQHRTPGGLSCKNGHGGAEPADPLS